MNVVAIKFLPPHPEGSDMYRLHTSVRVVLSLTYTGVHGKRNNTPNSKSLERVSSSMELYFKCFFCPVLKCLDSVLLKTCSRFYDIGVWNDSTETL